MINSLQTLKAIDLYCSLIIFFKLKFRHMAVFVQTEGEKINVYNLIHLIHNASFADI